MDPHRVTANVTQSQYEIWHLRGGSGWAHPIHIHFEEGQILSRGGAVPLWEQGARKDVYRLSTFPDATNSVDLIVKFREFMGNYMEHCHNTQHEDNAMLMRWDLKSPGSITAIPTPVQTWTGTTYEPTFGLTPNGGGGAVP
jgi:FtsP/CotA-like multicopper oxidase with cupredoxin domain